MSCGPKNLLPPPTLALAPEVAATSFTLGDPAPVAADAPSPWQWLNEWGGRRLLSDYPLDAITRRVDAKARIGCDPGALQSYRGTSVAYAGRYGPRRLGRIAERVGPWLADGIDVWGYFNNDQGGHAWEDASWLRERLGPSAQARTGPVA